MDYSKKFIILGCILAGLSVAIGAFGAHALKDVLVDSGRTETFETAVRYQFYHALGLLFLGLYIQQNSQSVLNLSGNLMFIGVLIFSGSLYVLCLSGVKWLGAITPIGGVFMIVSWILIVVGVLKK